MTEALITSERDGQEKKLSPVLENYVEIIFKEEAREGAARAKSIAEIAGVSRCTVTSTLKTLKSLGLVEYEPYSFIHLTEEGRRIGRDLMHRHIVFREFFQHVLQFDEVQADAIAGEIGSSMPRHVVRRCGRFVLYMQKNKDIWKDWQTSYEQEREALLAELASGLITKAGLSAEEGAELNQKYR